MKAVIILLTAIAALLLIFSAGCGLLPGEPPIPGTEADVGEAPETTDAEDAASAEEEPEDSVEQLISQVVEEEELLVEEEQNLTNETDETALIEISGSLDLQEDLSFCPHIVDSFSCDRYDVRRCEIKQIVGQNGYFPDLINCRAGEPDRNPGEKADNRYCIIQECQPIHEDNIVYAYGGPIIYAEYDYREEKVGGGIMTHYSLLRCGEMFMEFEDKFECTVYKAELDGLWAD